MPEAGHEMACRQVRKTEHAVAYGIVRIEAHEAAEGVNGRIRLSRGEVSHSAHVTVTPPYRGLTDTLDRVGKQRDVLSRRDNGA